MNAQDIINFIHNAEKKTPVKVYYRAKAPVDFPNCHQFGDVVFMPRNIGTKGSSRKPVGR